MGILSAASLSPTTLALPGHHRRVEHVGTLWGVLGLRFILAAKPAHPHVRLILHNLVYPPHAGAGFMVHLAANVDAVIMW